MPLCDGDCSECDGSGQVEANWKKKNELAPLPQNDDGALIELLLETGDTSDFTISVETHVRGGGSLSERQKEVINRILER